MPRKRRTKKRPLSCKTIMAQASRAFAAGDNDKGRALYHRAAKRGCRTTLTLDGIKGKRKRSIQRRRARR